MSYVQCRGASGSVPEDWPSRIYKPACSIARSIDERGGDAVGKGGNSLRSIRGKKPQEFVDFRSRVPRKWLPVVFPRCFLSFPLGGRASNIYRLVCMCAFLSPVLSVLTAKEKRKEKDRADTSFF
jgi:hypothetical protein